MQEKMKSYIFGKLVVIVGVSVLITNFVFYLIGALKLETGFLNIFASVLMAICLYLLHVKNKQEWDEYLESRRESK